MKSEDLAHYYRVCIYVYTILERDEMEFEFRIVKNYRRRRVSTYVEKRDEKRFYRCEDDSQ